MFAGYTERILEELISCMRESERTDFSDVCSLIDRADRIFLSGVGRTGYIMRCFSMRLAQAGYDAYWIGNVNTPSAHSGDLLILGSGSGETGTLREYASKAKRLGVSQILFTIHPQSSLGGMADQIIEIKASSKYASGKEKQSFQPMGALFEEALLITTEGIVLELMEKNQISESEMQKRHANLE